MHRPKISSATILATMLCVAAVAPADDTPATQPTSQATNLLRNGSFAHVDRKTGLPVGWTTKHPDNITVVDERGPRGRVVRFTGDADLMADYGVDLLSPAMPVRPNTRYRVTGLTRSDGPHIKVFVKGYATVTRRVDGEQRTFTDQVYQMRKDIKPSEDWQPFTLDFEIRPTIEFSDHQHTITEIRILLWAFWPAGACAFDDIRFEEVGPLSADERRHEAPVTHVGVAPRLGPEAERPPERELTDLWHEGVNAFKAEQWARAAECAAQLVAAQPDNADYRVLAARSLVALEQLDSAAAHAAWLTDPAQEKVAEWQSEWGQLVTAQVRLQRGDRQAARADLQALADSATSPHVRTAAQESLASAE